MKINYDKSIKEKYKSIPLIVPAYASRKKEYYTVEDIKEFDDLRYFLGEVNDHESYFKEEGIEFLKEVYGLKELSELLFKEGWYSGEYKNSDEIHEWLKHWEKESKNYSK